MRTCTYRSVLDRAVGLAGFTVGNLTTTPLTQFKTKIAARALDYWGRIWHPDNTVTELRYYRDAYDAAVAYVVDDQVYYATTGKYYTAILGGTGHVPTNTTYWEEATELDTYISLTQAAQTAIGEVRGVFVDDPRTTRTPRRLLPIPSERGIEVPGPVAPSSVYVQFRKRCPDFQGADYSATSVYVAGQSVYYSSTTAGYEGDIWLCLAAASAGQAPEGASASKWSKQSFPLFLRDCAAHGAYADWLRLDGAGDLAPVEDAAADAKFATEVIKLAGQGQVFLSRSA